MKKYVCLVCGFVYDEELGDPENTLRQDLWSIVEAIGDAQYHLMHNDILNASIVLSEISRVIKGS